MADLNINHITGKQGQQGTVLAGVTTVSSTGAMRIPSGPIDHRGDRGRGVIAGGGYPSGTTGMDYIDIASTGNGNDFGDLTQGDYGRASFSSSTRGVVGGGAGGSYVASIEYQTISSKGGTNYFGELAIGRRFMRATSNSSRGTWMGGARPSSDLDFYSKLIEFNEIATTGNASDFGDMTTGQSANATCSSPTRGISAGGQGSGPASSGTHYAETLDIEYITFATKGNATHFGQLTSSTIHVRSGAGLSSHTRGIFGGGNPGSPSPANKTNIIEYITIATLGNSIDFGDLTAACNSVLGTSNNTRGVFAGGYIAPAEVNTIQYITIASTGNAADFGDLVNSKGYLPVAYSDSHGGIGV